MSRDPSYPRDAAVGDDGADERDRGGGSEAARAAASARTVREGGSSRTRKIVAGAAIGIGSAAIVAALLYARKSRNDS
jgi:hypothetical protein